MACPLPADVYSPLRNADMPRHVPTWLELHSVVNTADRMRLYGACGLLYGLGKGAVSEVARVGGYCFVFDGDVSVDVLAAGYGIEKEVEEDRYYYPIAAHV